MTDLEKLKAHLCAQLVKSDIPLADATSISTIAVDGAEAALAGLREYFEPIEASPVWTAAMGIALQLAVDNMQEQTILMRRLGQKFGLSEKNFVVNIGGNHAA